MPVELGGTNFGKIDELVASVTELRTTLQICLAVIGVGFVLVVGLLAFLVLQSSRTSAKLDQFNDPPAIVRKIGFAWSSFPRD